MKNEKLQKVLARAGYGSRREIEVWINCDRVTVNGRTAVIGDRVSVTDTILLDGKPCIKPDNAAQTRILLYHKPEGEITSRHDPEGRNTVFDALPPIHGAKWLSVGRLDYNTSGLLLFTNDGELVHRLTHPSAAIEREYAVRVVGRVTKEITRRLTEGVELQDGLARFEDLVDSGGEGINHWFHVVVTEGRNRVVRKLWESQGITVNRLKRVRFGPIFLPKSLRKGAWLELDKQQIKHLYQHCETTSVVAQ